MLDFPHTPAPLLTVSDLNQISDAYPPTSSGLRHPATGRAEGRCHPGPAGAPGRTGERPGDAATSNGSWIRLANPQSIISVAMPTVIAAKPSTMTKAIAAISSSHRQGSLAISAPVRGSSGRSSECFGAGYLLRALASEPTNQSEGHRPPSPKNAPREPRGSPSSAAFVFAVRGVVTP